MMHKRFGILKILCFATEMEDMQIEVWLPWFMVVLNFLRIPCTLKMANMICSRIFLFSFFNLPISLYCFGHYWWFYHVLLIGSSRVD